jgi:hypothetical protein
MSPVEAWLQNIGDPTWFGWLTTAAYFVTAWLCFDSFRRARLQGKGERIWLLLAGGMLLLGFNKQLDLQSLLKEVGRTIAHRGGWFDQRREVQATFGGFIVALAAVSAFRIFWVARRQPVQVRWSLLGALMLIAFVVMRVASFEHLGMPNLGDNFNAIMEFAAVLCVAGGAWRRRSAGP